MAPSKKSRTPSKKISNANEVSPNKDGESGSRSRQRKRKLSDMLGLQWSKDELERFYGAYRKYGKDWKKVAAAVRNRTVEMVEALYSMNRAYLSLPEGTASVIGLIAMMTDHYSNLGGSDSEQESNEGTGTSRKPQKRARGKSRDHPSKGLEGLSDRLQFQSAAGCLSMLKKRRTGSTPRAVGKRTPRVPVPSSLDKDNRERYFSPLRQGLKLKVDDDMAHQLAVVLTEASQKGNSPQVSRTQTRKSKTPSSLKKGETMFGDSDMTSTKFRGSEMEDDGCELSLGSIQADNGGYAGDKNYSRSAEGSGVAKGKQKGKRGYRRRLAVEDGANDHLDDVKEACSGTEEGENLGTSKGNFEVDLYGKNAKASKKGSRKRSKKVLFGEDDGISFDALQTLADLSLMPETAADTESSIQVKDERATKSDDSKLKASSNLTPGSKVGSAKTSKQSKLFASDVNATTQAESISQNDVVIRKRRQKSSPIKISQDEAPTSSVFARSPNIKVASGVKKLVKEGKHSFNVANWKELNSVKPPEHTSSNDHLVDKNVTALPALQVVSAKQVNLPTKVRSRRKIGKQNLEMVGSPEYSESIVNGQSDAHIPLPHDEVLTIKENLSHFLSRYQARKWCYLEWFYSAIDYPWFVKQEFVEYLNHVGLGHVPRLTRVEWGVIKCSLGRPRRFSVQFLKEETEKLNQYRDSVRKHYAELHAGTREGLPTDLAPPLKVGQKVIALHPKAKEVHNGSVLTVDDSRYRIQFDQPELGVEFVKDIECMPSNLLESLPASLKRNSVSLNQFVESFNDVKTNGQPKENKVEGYLKFSPHENLEKMNSPPHISSPAYHNSSLLQQKGSLSNSNSPIQVGDNDGYNTQQVQNSQPSTFVQIQAREADVQALSELTRTLEKKEAVVSELKRMNDEVTENQKDGDHSLKDSESFKKQYAAILYQLSEINEQVSSALFRLRQRNTYQGNSSCMWLKPVASGEAGGYPSTFDQFVLQTQESGAHVAEIVETSRIKAKKMVDAATQAMALKGQQSLENVEELIDFVNKQLLGEYTHFESVQRTPSAHDQLTPSKANPSATGNGPNLQLNYPDQTEAHITSEFIARSLATMVMIQKCTERQFPPGDVARVLDSAVTSLQPCCSTNLPLYAEVQKCMGIIRNQILALIPT